MSWFTHFIVFCIFTGRFVQPIYDASASGVKTRTMQREPLNRNGQSEQVTVHDQYSRVTMQRAQATPSHHFGRSDSQHVMRIARPSSQAVPQPSQTPDNTRESTTSRENLAPLRNDRQGREQVNYDENELFTYGTECPPNGTGRFPYLMDCRQFLNCWKGRGYIQSCSPGTLFNPGTMECDHPSKVVCATLENPIGDRERLVTAASSPQAEKTTTKNQRLRQQPPSLLSQPDLINRGSVDYDYDNSFVPEEEVKCPRGGTGLFEHPYDCIKFLNCANGITYVQDCGPGTVFNPLFKICDWPHNVDCGTKRTTNHQQGGTTIIGAGTGTNSNLRRPRPNYGQGVLQARFEDLEASSSHGFHQTSVPTQTNLDRQIYPIYTRPTRPPVNHPEAINIPSLDLEPPKPPIHYPEAINIPSLDLEPPKPPSSFDNQQVENRQWDITQTGLNNNNWRPTTTTPSTINRWQLPWQRPSTPAQRPYPSTTPRNEQFYPVYNRQYYNQNQSPTTKEEDIPQQSLPVSEALQALLRPYLTKGGSGGTNQPNMTNVDWSSILGQTTEKPSKNQTELIFTGEQEHMVQFTQTEPNNPQGQSHIINGELGPQPIHPPFDDLPPGHSPEWHRNHPHVNTYGHHHHYPHNGRFIHNHPEGSPPPGPPSRWPHHHHHHNHRHHHGPHPHHHPYPNENEQIIPTTPTTLTLPRPPNQGLQPTPSSSFGLQDRFQPFSPALVPISSSVPQSINACIGQFNCTNDICVPYDAVCDGKNDCGNRFDESDCDHIGYTVRLSNELGTNHEGRVEVKVYDQWGYVCDDKFGMRDADVLCKELGFHLGASEVRSNSFYPPNANMMQNKNTTIFLMDEVDCQGNENSLRQCNFNGWGVHDCNAEELVGVVCKIPVMTCPLDYWLCDTSQECIPTGFLCDNVPDCSDQSDENPNHCNAPIQLRLAGGQTELEGRVEIKYRGIWGTICDDDFNVNEASIICRSLGYGGPSTVAKNTFGPGVGTIWLDQVSCIGNETSLEECAHWHWGEHNCAHTEDVGVKCTAGPVTPIRSTNIQYQQTENKSGKINEPFYLDNTTYFEFARSSKSLFTDQCGQVKVESEEDEFDEHTGFKVINGTKAKRGQHPWQATIRVKGQGKSSHWCGAVLISRFHLLTAAHCLVGFPKGSYFIRLGDHNADVPEVSEMEVFIENLYIHEDFRKGQHMNNDLALLVLKSPVRYTDFIQPVCLPPKSAVYFAGMNCTISGWGSIQSGKSTSSLELRAGIVPILDLDVCKQPHVYGNVITDGMFCAGSLDEGVDACDGDSGGPLVCTKDGVNTLYGIISWGQHCGYANKPGVYVKVAHYIDWIQEKLDHSMINYGV